MSPRFSTFLILFARQATPAFLAILEVLHGKTIGDTIAFGQATLHLNGLRALCPDLRGLTRSRIAAALAGMDIGTNLLLLD